MLVSVADIDDSRMDRLWPCVCKVSLITQVQNFKKFRNALQFLTHVSTRSKNTYLKDIGNPLLVYLSPQPVCRLLAMEGTGSLVFLIPTTIFLVYHKCPMNLCRRNVYIIWIHTRVISRGWKDHPTLSCHGKPKRVLEQPMEEYQAGGTFLRVGLWTSLLFHMRSKQQTFQTTLPPNLPSSEKLIPHLKDRYGRSLALSKISTTKVLMCYPSPPFLHWWGSVTLNWKARCAC